MNTVDYNKVFVETEKRGLLALHVCCAPCSCGVLPRLSGFELLPFFYNPNIDTIAEYDRRAEQFPALGIAPTIAEYDHDEFLAEVRGLEDCPEGGERCRKCIALRLRKTAEFAKEKGAEWFCSTLSVSPHKDAKFINEIGQALADEYGVKFLPNDFKKENGFLLSTKVSKELGIYRQDYCGCEFGKGIKK